MAIYQTKGWETGDIQEYVDQQIALSDDLHTMKGMEVHNTY